MKFLPFNLTQISVVDLTHKVLFSINSRALRSQNSDSAVSDLIITCIYIDATRV